MNKSGTRLIVVLAVAAALAGAAYFWLVSRAAPPGPIEVAVLVPTPATAPQSPATSDAQPARPSIEYPVEMIEQATSPSAPALPALAQADPYMRDALTTLLGRKQVLTFLQVDGFVRRVVATVDNLARSHAPWSVWPINPTGGRFTVLTRAGEQTISPDNGLRYAPFVQFVESVNTAQAVKLYVRAYPLFQQTYEALGFPGRYFNDRLVAVIDHLVATPVQTGPIQVHLVEVRGTVPSLRPWVRYEYSDPALESMSAGQKMLIRSGPVNHRRLRAKLMEVRQQIAGAALSAR